MPGGSALWTSREIRLVEGLRGFGAIDTAHVRIFEIDEKQVVSQNIQRFSGGLAG